MATVTYRCPNCDAGLVFDANKQKFVCEFCLSEFTKEELDKTASAERAEKQAEADAAFSDAVREYHCPSCGAEVVTDKETVANFCYYCHNPVVLTDRVSGMMRPSKVIPFKFDKQGAIDDFLAYTKKKHFLPTNYFDDAQIDKMSGVYFPYWVTDADTTGHYHARGHRVRTWRAGDYQYTEVKDYDIYRRGEIHFEDITTSALSTADKKMLEGILPYPTEAHIDFDMPYLLGYQAKKRDIDREALTGEVRGKMQGYAQTLLAATANDYTSKDNERCDLLVGHAAWEYTLLPVWILTYRDKKDKIFTYAMNGYTGKIYGELPVSFWKILLLALGTFAAAFLIFFLMGRFLL